MNRNILFVMIIVLSILISGCEQTSKNNIETSDNTLNQATNNLSTIDTTSKTILASAASLSSDKIIVDHTSTDMLKIPSCWIDKAKKDLKIAYFHTSHGSQIMSGFDAIEKITVTMDSRTTASVGQDEGDLYLEDNGGTDLSAGETTWYSDTRKFLNDPKNKDINVIMWSWCSIAGHNVEKNYIANIKKLVDEYGRGSSSHPVPVKFVVMTGHAEGNGLDDASDSRNKLIRDYCESTKGCVMLDFSDIENYDPDGNYYLDKKITDNLDYTCKTGTCNWAKEYSKKYPDSFNVAIASKVSDCAHSQSLTCALKAQAAWNMFARMSGWDGQENTC